MGRKPCCEKTGLRKGKWTEEEDDILIKYIEDNGEGSWRSLPKNAGLLRCGKSCRLRWINYLKAGIRRGNISKEEEEIIIKYHASYGNRWSLIASHLPGRTDNEIKNYWNCHLSRRLHKFYKNGNTIIVDLGNTHKVHSMKNSIATLNPTKTLVTKEQGKMILGEGCNKSSISLGIESCEFNLDENFLSPMRCCDLHVNWECLVLEEDGVKENAMALEEEDICRLWLWDANL